jgi:dolichol kinase
MMNWNRVIYYSIFTLLVSLLFSMGFANTHGVFLTWGFALAMGAGYAYGTYQAFAVSKQEFEKAMKDFLEK